MCLVIFEQFGSSDSRLNDMKSVPDPLMLPLEIVSALKREKSTCVRKVEGCRQGMISEMFRGNHG